MNNDLISREALKEKVVEEQSSYFTPDTGEEYFMGLLHGLTVAINFIDNAPAVEPIERIGSICEENCGYRPQGEFVEMLNKRITESVCKYCQMNKHCELCEISRVFSIITLTAEEQKGGAE